MCWETHIKNFQNQVRFSNSIMSPLLQVLVSDTMSDSLLWQLNCAEVNQQNTRAHTLIWTKFPNITDVTHLHMGGVPSDNVLNKREIIKWLILFCLFSSFAEKLMLYFLWVLFKYRCPHKLMWSSRWHWLRRLMRFQETEPSWKEWATDGLRVTV